MHSCDCAFLLLQQEALPAFTAQVFHLHIPDPGDVRRWTLRDFRCGESWRMRERGEECIRYDLVIARHHHVGHDGDRTFHFIWAASAPFIELDARSAVVEGLCQLV